MKIGNVEASLTRNESGAAQYEIGLLSFRKRGVKATVALAPQKFQTLEALRQAVFVAAGACVEHLDQYGDRFDYNQVGRDAWKALTGELALLGNTVEWSRKATHALLIQSSKLRANEGELLERIMGILHLGTVPTTKQVEWLRKMVRKLEILV
jgi:hypothetical protein